jgi:isocitrate lyase
VIARTDAEAADLLTSDYDANDKFLTGERTAEGFYKTKKGLEQAISRAVAYADYADLVWCETGTPDLEFASLPKPCTPSIRANCWPTTARRPSTGRRTWTMPPSPSSSANWVPWATIPVHHFGWYPQHVVQHVRPGTRLRCPRHVGLRREGTRAEFAARERGYTFVSHQQEVGTYFDDVTTVIQGPTSYRADRLHRRRAVPLSAKGAHAVAQFSTPASLSARGRFASCAFIKSG